MNYWTIPGMLRGMIGEPERIGRGQSGTETIIEHAANYFNVPVSLIKSKNRDKYLVKIRCVIIEVLLNRHFSKVAIGKALNLHHSTIIHHKGNLYSFPNIERHLEFFNTYKR